MSQILNNRYYPTLTTLVDANDIPNILGFVKDGIITVLGKIHYKDLQFSKSPRGDAAFYSLSILTKKRLDFEILGTGTIVKKTWQRVRTERGEVIVWLGKQKITGRGEASSNLQFDVVEDKLSE